ncbi:hypothetical protein EJ02DRAFT_437367 [Clathrospora elynae]|uniref:Uncharacterized protein n=1 Tax=Clathrospora elynae TaxID=706981 RepID=A0A6A5SBY8_9PLEO|nr:hypothetical protein EJ02DRAFT_437367 [Clathrospora elynae]
MHVLLHTPLILFFPHLISALDSPPLTWQTPNDPPSEPFTSADMLLKPNARNFTTQVNLRGWEGCDAEDPCNPDLNKRRIIKAGFEEMQKMIPNAWNDVSDPSDGPSIKYPFDWNSAAAVQFWGSFAKTADYRQLVQDNMDTLASQVSGDWFGWTLHVRCDDPAHACNGPTNAYVIHGGGLDDHINFCDSYYRLRSLDMAVDTEAAGGIINADVLTRYWNRATVWAHEIMHVSWIGKVNSDVVGGGWMTDIKYGRITNGPKWKQYRVLDSKWLALGDESPAYAASHNPQNYAWFALSNYITKRRGFYPSAEVWDSTMEPPQHPIENANAGETVSDEDSAGALTGTRPGC